VGESQSVLTTAAALVPASKEETWITASDFCRSTTAHMLRDLKLALEPLHHAGIQRMLDIGCGFGGVARFVGMHLGVNDIRGLDRDLSVLAEARAKGVAAELADLAAEPLPHLDGAFDLVTSFGMLDYFADFDVVIQEMRRVLRARGYAMISLPNLAGWQNRIALLLGYQPRDVEVSKEFVVGVHPHYRTQKPSPVGHIHTVTTAGFRELMERHGFETLRVTGAQPVPQGCGWLVARLDGILSRSASLARRFFYLGKKRTEKRI
jgi:SAM-dependent methyltransferase